MNNYDDLRKKYGSKIESGIGFDKLIEKLLKNYTSRDEIIKSLFDERSENATTNTSKEQKVIEKGDKIYNKLISMCNNASKEEVENVIDLINSNKEELASLYELRAYSWGLEDYTKYQHKLNEI